MRLCGISSHFWLLSPCIRQVTHALLTRPPLEIDQIHRSLNEIFPVRLACVKHAASVHPEPGSNSLIKCLITQDNQLAISRFTVFGLFNRSQIMKFVSYEPNRIRIFRCSCVKNFRESYVFHCLVIKVVCLATACLLYHISFSLSRTFFKFFQSFSNSSGFPDCSSDLWLSALFKRLDYFNIFVLSCQALF